MAVALRLDSSWSYQFCLAVCCALGFAVGTGAQAQTAMLEGTVQDTSGGVIANAVVVVRERETNQTRTALTDGQGSARQLQFSVDFEF